MKDALGFEVVDDADPSVDDMGFTLVGDVDELGFAIVDQPDTLADQARGVKESLITGRDRALRDVDVLLANADAAVATKAPTRPQAMRAREMAMADPRRLESRIDPTGGFDFSRGERRFGIPATTQAVRSENQVAREARAVDIALQTEALANRPRSQAMQAFDALEPNDWKGIASAIARDPIEIIANVAAESLPASLVGLPAGPAGIGVTSGATEFASGLVEQAQRRGYDFKDPERVLAFFKDKDALRASSDVAATKAGVVGTIDALTAGLAGRFVGPALGHGVGKVLAGTAKEIGMQMLGGAGGEALGSLASGQPVQLKDVVLEALGELAGAPAETVSNLRNQVRQATGESTPPAEVVIPPPDPDSDLQIPGDESSAVSPPVAAGGNSQVILTSSPEAPVEPQISPIQEQGAPQTEDTPVAPETPVESLPAPTDQAGVVAPAIQLPTTEPAVAQQPDPSQPALPQPAPAPALEERIQSLKVDTRGKLYDITAGLPIAIWNAGLDVATAAVKGGKAIAAAVQAAVDYIKSQYADPIDETVVRQKLEEHLRLPEDQQAKRKFALQVQASTDVSGEVKGLLTNVEYRRRSNENDNAFASRVIAGVGGPEKAIEVFRDSNSGLPQAVRGFLAQQIIKRLGEQEQAAALHNPAESSRLAEVAARFVDQDLLEETTSAGQFIQSFAAFAALTPRGMLGVYRRTLDRVSRKTRERLQGALGTMADALNRQNREGLVDLGRDTKAGQATGEAITEAIQASPEVNEAVRVVIRGSIGRHRVVQQQVRDLVQKAFARRARKVGNGTVWGRYVDAAVRAVVAQKPGAPRRLAALDEFTRTVSSVLRSQVQAVVSPAPGTVPDGLSAVQRLTSMFLNREKVLEVWARVVGELRERFPNDPRVQEITQNPAALFSPKLLKEVIEQEMEASELSLRDLVAGHYRALGDGQTLRDRIVAATGLSGDDAKSLSEAVDRVWRQEIARIRNDIDTRVRRLRSEPRLARAARSGQVDVAQAPDDELDAAIRSQLQRLRTSIGAVLKGHYTNFASQGRTLAEAFVRESRIPEPVAKVLAEKLQQRFRELLAERRRALLTRMRSEVRGLGKMPVDQIAEAASLGILTDQKVWDAMAKQLGLPTYSPQVAAEITKRANALQRKPEGFQRDEAAIDLLNFIANQQGVSFSDLTWAFWYANTLSGPITHLVNALSNAQQLAAHISLASIRDPAGVLPLLGSLSDGFRAGWDEAANVLSTGKVTGTRAMKMEASQPLERLGTGGWRTVLDKYKYVSRAMGAADLLFYKPAEIARKQALARAEAKRDGLRGEALQRRVGEILQMPPGAMAAAEAQAVAEGLTGRNARRRAREILDQKLREDLREDARQYALRVTFNNEPFGVLGSVARWLKPMIREVPALRLVVPFVNVAVNVTNEALAYFPPVGATRAIWGHARGQLNGRPLDLTTESGRADLFDAYAKAAVGLGAMTLLAALGASDLDKEDPDFAIYGAGPSDRNRRRQLRETGWRPWTVKIGGRFISYADTPVAIALGVVGAYQDALRWKDLGEAAALDRVAVAAQAVPRIILQRSFLAGLSDFLVGISREASPAKSAERTAAGLARAASSFVVPNLLRQLDRLMDPTVTDQATIEGALISQVPFVRRAGRPALNILGQPVVSSPVDRFTTTEQGDTIWRVLAAKQAWPSSPDQRDLTDEQFYELTRIRGEWMAARLKQLEPQLRAAPPETAQAIVRRISEIGTRYARAQVANRQ